MCEYHHPVGRTKFLKVAMGFFQYLQIRKQHKHNIEDGVIYLIIVHLHCFEKNTIGDSTKPVSDIVHIYLYLMHCIQFCTIFYQIFHDASMPCLGCHTNSCFAPLKQNFTTMRDLIGFSKKTRREQFPINNF